MVRYYSAACALKFFSSSRATRWFYRNVLGNRFGKMRRVKQGLHVSYIQHAAEVLNFCRKYSALADGMRVLEVGTGWVHFYSLFLRLFFDVRVTMVDAWDNRQLPALRRFFADLDRVLDNEFELSDEQSARAHRLLKQIVEFETFEDLYSALDLEYVIDPKLSTVEGESYDLILSQGVLEHVRLTDVPEQIANMSRALRPKGMQFHHIGIGDHLAHYDRRASMKQYITYSDRMWKLLFENSVQYVNRIQKSEFKQMFVESGMELLEEGGWSCDIRNLSVSDRFRMYSRDDLECVAATLVMRKR